MSTKGCSGFILFCLGLDLFAKIKKDLVSPYSLKPFCKMCAKFQQKILNSVVVEAHQNFHFFRQTAWFLGNNRALSKFRNQILCYLISIIRP